MRAIQMKEFGGPEVLQLVELPVPEPAPGEVLIRVSRAGLNFADTHTRTNSYVRKATLPLVPGGEVAGVREDTGERVVALVGDGGYAEYATAPLDRVFPIPDGLSDGQALAMIIQGTTAWHLHRTAGRLAPGESVVVHSGSGGVGSLAVQLARRMGAGRVIATATSEERRALTLELGADAALDPDPEGLTERLLEANGGAPVDVVYDMSGGAVFDASYRALAPFGRIVVCGIATGEQNELRTGSLLRHSRSVVGFYLFHCLEVPMMFARALEDLFERLLRGELRVIVGDTYKLDQAATAQIDLRERRTTGKLLLDPSAWSKTFAELGLSGPTLQALADVGYESPSPIQEEAIPGLLEGRDVIGQAQTGTGKTAAFGLPIMEYIDASEHSVQALVLTPTRELCIQVTQALRTYASHSGVDVVAVFGGAPIRTQQAQLRAGGHVVVGTVGRVLDLISRHSLMLHDCRFVVLDEADEMLDLGFLEDVEKILSLTPSSRQTALFSATMPPPIRKLADRYMYDPTIIQVEAATLTIDTVAQFQLPVDAKNKPDKLVEVLRAEAPEQAIVFVRTKIRCDQLYRTLRDRGMNVRALHGDMSQGSRDGVMLAFKGGRVPILVATDVAARGLDISTVTHVINYDVPTSPDTYVHRIGRTGRVGRSGRAITFVEDRQKRELEAIERHIGTSIAQWQRGAEAAPTPVRERPRRHSKPRISRRDDAEPYEKLVLGSGRAAGLKVADIVGAVTSSAGLDGEAVRDVLVLDRFSFVSVPAAEVDRVIEALDGRSIGTADTSLSVQRAPVR